MTLPTVLFHTYTVASSAVLLLAFIVFARRKGLDWLSQEMAREQHHYQTLEQEKQGLGNVLEELDHQIMAQQEEFQELQRAVFLWRDACARDAEASEQTRRAYQVTRQERERVRANYWYQEQLVRHALPQAARHAHDNLVRRFSHEAEQRLFVATIFERLAHEDS